MDRLGTSLFTNTKRSSTRCRKTYVELLTFFCQFPIKKLNRTTVRSSSGRCWWNCIINVGHFHTMKQSDLTEKSSKIKGPPSGQMTNGHLHTIKDSHISGCSPFEPRRQHSGYVIGLVCKGNLLFPLWNCVKTVLFMRKFG